MVVDDSAVIRGFIARWLEEDPEIEVVATASNGQIAVNNVASSKAEVVVLDIEMPVMDGLTALPQLLKAVPDVKVVMASTPPEGAVPLMSTSPLDCTRVISENSI